MQIKDTIKKNINILNTNKFMNLYYFKPSNLLNLQTFKPAHQQTKNPQHFSVGGLPLSL